MISGFLIIGASALVVGFLGWTGVSKTDEALKELAENRLPGVIGLSLINEAHRALQKGERGLLIPEMVKEEKERNRQLKNLEGDWQKAEQGFKTYEPLLKKGEEARLWRNFKVAWEEWKKEHNKVVELALSGKREAGVAQSVGKARETYYAAAQLLEELTVLNQKNADEFSRPAMAQAGRARMISLLGMISGTALAIFLGVFLSLSIIHPINRVAAGLASGAGQVAFASSEVSSASQSLAEGASEQAAGLEETSSSMEEMSSMTKQNSDNAQQAKAMMGETQQIVEDVNRHMGHMAEAIGQITKSSEETGKIIKTIDEIAFQTNLLALNAAVEAARAGEAGAGFAVVADEVRNLAMRASEAAKNTNILIENTIKAVKNGNELTQATQEAFKRNIDISSRISKLIDEIAAASQEQAQGLAQVNKAVAEMDKVVQQNAASAQQSASTAEEMSAQASQMKNFVDELTALVEGRQQAQRREFQKITRPKEEKKTQQNWLVSNPAPKPFSVNPTEGQEASQDTGGIPLPESEQPVIPGNGKGQAL